MFACLRNSRSTIAVAAAAALLGWSCSDDDGVIGSGPPPAECFDFRDYLHIAGHVNTEGDALGVDAGGAYAYVADGDKGLVVVDVSDPVAPAPAGGAPTSGPATDVAVDGDVACVTAGDAGLLVFDVSDPAQPVLTATLGTPGSALGVFVVPGSQRLVYVADSVIGLMIFDVTDPDAPVAIGVETTPGRPRDVVVVGQVAYVADASLGVRIVSVVDPTAPWLVGNVPTPGQAEGITAAGDYVFVADGGAGLQVVTTQPPRAIVGSLDTPGSALDVVVRGNTAFVADRFSGLRVIDVSQPDAPEEVSVSESSGVTAGVALAGDLVLAADGEVGVRVVDASSNAGPPRRQGMPGGVGKAVDVVTDSAMVYVADAERGLVILELQNGVALERGELDVGGTPEEVHVLDGRAYIAAGDPGIIVVDVNQPATPFVVETLPSSSGAISLAISDSVVCSVRGIGSFNVVDLSGEFPPRSLPISGNNYISRVDAVDRLAYLSSRNGRVHVVDFSELTDLRLIHLAATTGRPQGIAAHGGHLFVASDQGGPVLGEDYSYGPGVELYDLNNPRQPPFVKLIEMSGAATRVSFDGDVMYVAAAADGVEVFDISDPLNARRLGSFSTNAVVGRVAVAGDWLVVAGGTEGVYTLPAQCAR